MITVFGWGKDGFFYPDRQGERPLDPARPRARRRRSLGVETRVLFPIDGDEFFAGPQGATDVPAPGLAGAA